MDLFEKSRIHQCNSDQIIIIKLHIFTLFIQIKFICPGFVYAYGKSSPIVGTLFTNPSKMNTDRHKRKEQWNENRETGAETFDQFDVPAIINSQCSEGALKTMQKMIA